MPIFEYWGILFEWHTPKFEMVYPEEIHLELSAL